MNGEYQIAISALTVLGAGFSVYVGVRVALSELRKDISTLTRDIVTLDARIKRIEDPYFQGHK